MKRVIYMKLQKKLLQCMFKLKQNVKLLFHEDHRLYMTTLDFCL